MQSKQLNYTQDINPCTHTHTHIQRKEVHHHIDITLNVSSPIHTVVHGLEYFTPIHTVVHGLEYKASTAI